MIPWENLNSQNTTSGDRMSPDTSVPVENVFITRVENGSLYYEHVQVDTFEYLVYTFIIPTLGIFGFLANLINAIIFMRPRMTPSAFTYLAALSFVDSLSCLLLALSSFTKTIFRKDKYWLRFNYQFQIPLTGITTGAANLILVFVTLDRLVYLKKCLPRQSPRFCTRKVARINVTILCVFSTFINIPYFFIFKILEDGNILATKFFYSTYYAIHNWITFILLAIIPGIFLLISNAIMISVIRKWSNCSKQFRGTKGTITTSNRMKTTTENATTTATNTRCSNTNLGNSSSPSADGDLKDREERYQKRNYYQTKLTISIVAVISLFLVGELPARLTSERSAISLLFGNNIENFQINSMEKVRVLFRFLNILQLSLNIVIYAIINPAFLMEFFHCFRKIFDYLHRIAGIDSLYRFFSNLKSRSFENCSKLFKNKNGLRNRKQKLSLNGKSTTCINRQTSRITIVSNIYDSDLYCNNINNKVNENSLIYRNNNNQQLMKDQQIGTLRQIKSLSMFSNFKCSKYECQLESERMKNAAKPNNEQIKRRLSYP